MMWKKTKKYNRDIKPVTINRLGIKHFYSGARPPWEFDFMVMEASDLNRVLRSRTTEVQQDAFSDS